MTSQYRCETCNRKCGDYIDDVVTDGLFEIRLMLETVTTVVGCTIHSDFQSEREKVLDELLSIIQELSKQVRSDEKRFDSYGKDYLYDRGKSAGVAIFCEQYLPKVIKKLRKGER